MITYAAVISLYKIKSLIHSMHCAGILPLLKEGGWIQCF